MAKNSSSTNTVSKVPKKKRKGIHSKKKNSQLKTSKNYKKLRVGQG